MSKTLKYNLFQSSMFATALVMGAVVVALTPMSAQAQDYTSGGLKGVVYGADGTPSVGNTVTLTSTDRGFDRTTVTDSTGAYRFTRLPIGAYTVEADGAITESAKVSINGFTYVNLAPESDEIITTAQRQSILINDFSANQLGLVIDVTETFETQPLARNLASIALLAPGTTGGDSAFGNLASISGSSVAENAYYINGMNTTDFRNFVGSSSIPFEFYDQVETKTGGYSAEFGRSTGGVINSVTKSGSNEFKFGANMYYEPDEFRQDSPTTYNQSSVDQTQFTSRDSFDGNLWASGPIIKDRLFFFGLYNANEYKSQSYTRDLSNPVQESTDSGLVDGNLDMATTGRTTVLKNDDPFYGAKFDFFLTDNHQFEYTFIRDKSVNTVQYGDVNYTANGSISDVDMNDGLSYGGSGGDMHIGKYTGNFGKNLTVSALYGHQTIDQTTSSSTDDIPVVINAGGEDSITGLPYYASDYASFYISSGSDTRELMRADVDYYVDNLFGEHHFRAGVDREELTAVDSTIISGGVYYLYLNPTQCDSASELGDAVSANHTTGSDCVRIRDYSSGGSFETIQTALYLQDAWQVTDSLTLNLGIRNETFDNRDAAGETFTKLTDQWAPRLGFAFSLPDERSQLFGSWGRYHLPVAANTNIRLAGAETYIHTYYDISGANSDLTPQITGSQFLERVTGDGTVGETSSLVNADLEPMYSDEAILGFRHHVESSNDFLDGWDTSIALTYRDLKSTLEDVAIDAAVLKYCEREGIQGCEDVWEGFHQYVLTNPGFDMSVTSTTDDLAYLTDSSGNALTELIQFELSAEDLGYPEASRKYVALDLTAKKNFDWGLADISYTFSESRGNYEGSVKSDNGQDDAGLTQDFDQPGLVDGAYGLLPNNRTHKLKVRGYYNVNDDLTIGGNYGLTSPRNYGCIGVHPTDYFAQAYGASSNYCDGELVPRGSVFTSDWVHTMDMSFAYSPSIVQTGKVTFRADVFNILGNEGIDDIQEYGEDSTGANLATYGLATSYQSPRRVRFGINYTY